MKKIKLINNGAPAEGAKRCDPSINPATNGLVLEWTSKKAADKKDPYANQSDAWGERMMKIFKLSESDACMKEFIEIAQENGMEMDAEKEPSVPEEKKKMATSNSKPTLVKEAAPAKKAEEGSPEEEAEESDEEAAAEGDEEEK